MNKKSEAIKKQFVAVLFSCLFILGLTSTPALGQQPKLKVGIIHIGSITDGGYN